MRSPALCLMLVCVLSCASRQDAPRLDKVSPDQTLFGSPERLLLSGSFTTDLAVDLGSDAPPSVENRFEVRIGPELAYAVRLRSRDTLEATAPATLPPGRHDITVTDAQGRSFTLPEALEVIDRDVHRLVFVTSMRSAHPGEWTEPIRLELRDPAGQPAPTSTQRTLRISSDSYTGRFARLGGEEEAQPELEVTLAPGEWGLDLYYQDSTPGYHTLESSSQGLPSIAQTVAVGRLGPPTAVRYTRVPSWPLRAGEPAVLAVDVLDDSGGPASLPATGILLELSTSSPAGGLAVNQGDPYHPALSFILQGSRGRLPILYLDTHSSAEVWLTAKALNRDTLTPLESDRVNLRVEPGPTRHFEVLRAGTGPLQAGIPERFTVQAQDDWGNPTSFQGTVLLEAFPADPDFHPNSVGLEAGRASFTASFTRVQMVSVMATDPNAPTVRGASAELSIRPGMPVRLAVSTVEGPQQAGRPFSLLLEALDRYGNRAETPLSVTLSASGVPEGALSPTTSGDFRGAITLPVTITSALDETRLTLTEGTPDAPGALSATTGNFAVLPGPTQRFVVEDTTSPQRADKAFAVRIRAVDTYGNLTRDVHDLQLGADGVHAHLFSPTSLSGFQGRADVMVTLWQATPSTRVLVSNITNTLKGQQVGGFAVSPSDFAGYLFQKPVCIADGDRWRLTLTAVDKWNNFVPDYTGTARLTLAPFGTINPTTTRAFSAGTLTESNVVLEGVTGRAPNSCLQLTATDTVDANKSTTTCLNLQTSCP
ncbi:hypothetical protein JRI60_49745 [Archangium violaceum]|uniref:hypothetical protein n=1 Tax=Archangium violaceum TaxID=83451 RepID=UPI0019513722|nr:hypothetical protein [Archangium violaceum]QRN96967.1 hypothetical protein JRI60_49745 [Archangium violaceum]